METLMEVATNIMERDGVKDEVRNLATDWLLHSDLTFHRQGNFTVAAIDRAGARTVIGVAKRSKSDPVKPIIGQMTALARAVRRLIEAVEADLGADKSA